MASFIIPDDGFNVTDHGPDVVPPLILQAEVQTLYIEFLKMDTDGRTAEEIASLKNHAILKADFVRDVDIYSGARINMVVNFDVLSETSAGGNSHKLGMLLVRPIKYRASSFSSACTAVLPLKQRVTFEHLIRAITDNNLQYFYFCTVDEKYYGCRDFV
ncbi:hypothetical protein TRV_08115 [Trichophyton verrucosum HKI 0517]|uniref:Uncharacterized protein n=1 Tax=Trichophyton verrucosum (strain HKI 0517) TaxID=663202 RepID=D4DLP1_TRIVH|nr:uncharacterized protein TRV_08115 [Trichophyton verrucosum HKI 0517]EFE37214.1 hypothetical protein TRV_08115 [Trichophyton verrucosum HKI 0517]